MLEHQYRSEVAKEKAQFPAAGDYLTYNSANKESLLLLGPSAVFTVIGVGMVCNYYSMSQDLNLPYLGAIAALELISTPLIFQSKKEFAKKNAALVRIATTEEWSADNQDIEIERVEHILDIASPILPGASLLDDAATRFVDDFIFQSSPADLIATAFAKDMERSFKATKLEVRNQSRTGNENAMAHFRVAMSLAVCAWGIEVLNPKNSEYRNILGNAVIGKALSEKHRAHPLSRLTPDTL